MPSRCPARRGALFRTIGLALVLVGAGCRVVAGIDDRAPPSSPPLVCGGLGETYFERLAARSPGCLSCLSDGCCSQGNACAEQSACVELSACRESCTPYDVACEQQCEGTHADGVAALDALKTCTLDTCPEQCRIGTLWDCVGHSPALKKPSSGTVQVQISLTPIGGSAESIEGALVEACESWDKTCQSPSSKATADANGDVTLSIKIIESLAFNGYLRVTQKGYLPLYVLMNPPIVADVTLPPLVVASRLALGGFAVGGEAGIDEGAGHIIAFALDCGGAFAPGVSFVVSETAAKTKTVYTRATGNGFDPDPDLTETTAKLGLGVILNVPPGEVTLSYTANAPQLLVGSHTVQVFPGAITQVPAIALP